MQQSISRFGNIYEKLTRLLLFASCLVFQLTELFTGRFTREGDFPSRPTQDFETETIWNSPSLYCETDWVPRDKP